MRAQPSTLLNLVVILTLMLPGGTQPAAAQRTAGPADAHANTVSAQRGTWQCWGPGRPDPCQNILYSVAMVSANQLIAPAGPRIASQDLDQLGGATTRVSIASDGAQGNGKSDLPASSADGRYVVFSSEANSLVSGDNNNAYDIFVRDRQTRQTTRVSVTSDGGEGDGQSFDASISADGRYVAFKSWATNLVAGDGNGEADVFVRDRDSDEDGIFDEPGQVTTVRISVDSKGAEGDALSIKPAISADGRYVAFESWASNLVTGDTNGQEDVFVHDRQTGQTIRVSVASDGAQANDQSDLPAISADARFVAFASEASNLVSGDNNNVCDTNSDGMYTDNCPDVFVHDRDVDEDDIFDEPGQVSTVRVSVTSDGTQAANGWSAVSSLSSDGNFVAFESQADDLVTGDTNGVYDIFVRDRQAGVTSRVSVASDGAQGNAESQDPSLSADGRYVAFVSQASLVSDDTNGMSDIYLHDRQTRQTVRVSIASDGTPGNGNSKGAALSADGYYVAFSSSSDNLVSDDTNGWEDVFVHETISPTICPTITDWKGEYWNNDSLSGPLARCRNDIAINFEWFAGPPDPVIVSNHFSARWTRDITFTAGDYRFDIFHDDGARLYIDEVLVFENWCGNCRQTDSVTVTLTGGLHNLKLEMYENIGWAAAILSWDVVVGYKTYLPLILK